MNDADTWLWDLLYTSMVYGFAIAFGIVFGVSIGVYLTRHRETKMRDLYEVEDSGDGE